MRSRISAMAPGLLSAALSAPLSAALSAALLAACAASPQAPAPSTPVATPGPQPAQPEAPAGPRAAAERPPLEFIEDDVPAALARARDEGKVLFVDAWAPWCHTCLSMKHYVLTDPSLRPLADRVVFAAIDTDRPENAAFMERYQISVWPTFFVIDPADGQVVGLWTGAASAAEVKEVLDQGLLAMDDRAGAARPPNHPDRIFIEARRAHAAGDHAAAAAAYDRALAAGGPGWARRSDALYGELQALYGKKDHAACARFGREHLGEVKGSAIPADFSSLLLACARALPAEAKADAQAAREAAMKRLGTLTREPPPEATPDDRADALGILAGALKDAGDAAGAQAAQEARLAILERAAREAKTPEAAATHDYARAMTYLELGRGEEAVKMLVERERQITTTYEPSARLAQVLHAMGREPEALAAVDRALGKAYGPRRPRYLKLKAEIQGKLGDVQAQAATLREEVAAYEGLAKGLRREEWIADAKRRLGEAEKALGQQKDQKAPKR